jgi:hypothetical protein
MTTTTPGKGKQIHVPDRNASFIVKEHNGLRLIHPTKAKHKWSNSELHLRSCIVDEAGHVVSMGFPKFRNAGENIPETHEFENALASGEDILFTEKMDGSLAIRSVIRGEVVWRTRNTFDGGTEHGPAIRKAAQRYPILSDPAFMPDHSLLFEFCSPEFPIIVQYKEADLVLLGAISHADLSLHTYAELQSLSANNDLHLVRVHQLPSSFEELCQAVVDYDDCEGVVCRYQGEQHYLKIKSSKYLAQHSMRFSFGQRRALELCQRMDFTSEKEYLDHLYSLGLDYEVGMTRLPYYHAYTRARTRTLEMLADAQAFVNIYGDLAYSKRKEYARLVHENSEDGLVRAACFSLLDGKAETVRERMLKHNIEQELKRAKLTLDDNTAEEHGVG